MTFHLKCSESIYHCVQRRHQQDQKEVCRKLTFFFKISCLNKHSYSALNTCVCETLIKTWIPFKFKLLLNVQSIIISYKVIKIHRVNFSLSPETENIEFSYSSSQPSLCDSKWSLAFNLVPLQMSGRQRASSVTAIDQALFSTTTSMDGVSQGPHTARQSSTSQLALPGGLQRMPSLTAQPMSFMYIIIMT